MFLRNKLFDWGILPTEKFDIPVISVGNLSLGGTGKTPHVEYLVRLLKDKHAIATLSRGYGRETRGFVEADADSDYKTIGDEPLQYKNKFENLVVCVDGNRRRGIKKLLEKHQELDAVILDDAYQHRYVKPGISILLTDFHNLYSENFVVPTGTLREFRSGSKRADVIFVTKTPSVLSPFTRRRLEDSLKPRKHQQLFFSHITYQPMQALPGIESHPPQKKCSAMVLFCGIANSYPLQEHLKKKCRELIVMEFPDHHKYDQNDLKKIIQTFRDVFTTKKILVTTEKDAMRLIKSDLIEYFKDYPVFYVPIEIEIHGAEKSLFDKQILEYVERNQSNGRTSPGQNTQ